MHENFLILLAGFWLAFAAICDFRKREIPDWVSFSLVAFALSYRAFVSIFYWQDFFTPGLIGLAVFFALGEGIYRIGFGGGDAKLLTALGSVVPFSFSFLENIYLLGVFFVSLMFIGAGYSLLFSLAVALRGWKKFSMKLKQEFLKRKKCILLLSPFFLISLALAFFNALFLFASALLFITPILLVYSKAVEELMVKEIKVGRLTIGDWLYENVKVNRKIIKPSTTGLNEKELKILQNYKGKVKIKEGVPFTISFLLAFIFLVLWHSNRGFFNYYLGLFGL